MPEKLEFFDVKARDFFETDQYEIVEKETKRGKVVMAVATSPLTGIKAYRIIKFLGKKKQTA